MAPNVWRDGLDLEYEYTDSDAVISSVIAVCTLVGFAGLIAIILGLAKHFAVCGMTPDLEVKPTQSAESRKKQLDKALPQAVFSAWYQGNHDKHMSPASPRDRQDEQVCIICLDVLQGEDLIRALKCGHVYHTDCFDRWFTRSHDYCPLCHRLVLGPVNTSEVA